MTWKKKQVGVCVVALAAWLIWMPQATQANEPAPSMDDRRSSWRDVSSEQI